MGATAQGTGCISVATEQRSIDEEAGLSGIVSVLGRATVAAQPDEVEISLEINHLARTHQDALADVARRSTVLEATFSTLNIERTAWTTSGVIVAEENSWENGKQVFRGYRATNRLTVRLTDAERIGKLINAAISATQAQVHGPTWRIAPSNPAHAAACRDAALDARRKAEAYVEALGARLGDILSVSEPGVDYEPPQPRPVASMRMMKAEASMAMPEVTVQAGELDVTASVEVTFAIVQR